MITTARDVNEFGFTNDRGYYLKALAFREKAIADGWTPARLFDFESIETATKLTKDGFVMHILTRLKEGRYEYRVCINAWGPDGLYVIPPEEYDWVAFVSGLKRCHYCQAEGVDTERVSFAGRCCRSCLPEQRKVLETPGWTR